jgi:hypothetical protein
METNNIDKIVRDSLQSKTIQPSSSAWERLSNQLDVVEAPVRINWFKYVGYAASVLLLISVAFFINTEDTIDPIQKNDIVIAPVIDTTDFVRPSIDTAVPLETVIVKVEVLAEEKKSVISKRGTIKEFEKKVSTALKGTNVVKENSRSVLAENTSSKKNSKKTINSRIKIDSDALLLAVTDSNMKVEKPRDIIIPDASKELLNQSRIKINSDALLYAVSNPNKDINEYYKKYSIDRDEVLENIQKELNKVNLKVNASTLLTAVEKTIDEETFKKSLLQVVKGKINGLASAFSNRNN